MTIKGPLMPAHRRGKCMFDPSVAGGVGGLCGAVAIRHLLVVDADESWSTFACSDHLEPALRLLQVGDWHDVEATCLGSGSIWQAGPNPPGDGFCFDPDEDLAADAAASILEVVAS